MADAKTERQKVKEITDKLEEGLKELFARNTKTISLPRLFQFLKIKFLMFLVCKKVKN